MPTRRCTPFGLLLPRPSPSSIRLLEELESSVAIEKDLMFWRKTAMMNAAVPRETREAGEAPTALKGEAAGFSADR